MDRPSASGSKVYTAVAASTDLVATALVERRTRPTRAGSTGPSRDAGLHDRGDEPWLWLGRRGRLMDSGILQVVRRRSRQAGLGKLHPHLFRHTFAHEMLSAGMQEGDLLDARRMAGPRDAQSLRDAKDVLADWTRRALQA